VLSIKELMKNPKRPELCVAIASKQVIEFDYHDKHRKGNPQCYGINKTGKEALRVHLIEGGGRDEQMFLCDDIHSENSNPKIYPARSEFQ
jgi:hypothetical protein